MPVSECELFDGVTNLVTCFFSWFLQQHTDNNHRTTTTKLLLQPTLQE